MSGEQNLEKLLASLQPQLVEGEFTFCCFEDARYGDYSDLEPIASFQEKEGLTLVIPLEKAAEKGLASESLFRCISLNIHSSLNAVGLTTAFSQKLAEHGISANVFAGFYHDHIFVASEDSERALEALREFSGS